ncbi:cobalamin synthesis protein/P47K family protein [Staphylococcus agnetis]|uniref:CobW family GTP-binding protein n=1 Tax=Staphylococcus agnetis TaxID=985762 RepID=UPI000DFB1F13|nr:GTP-binding protein [Staphylococcus agnetis]SUK17027.1 cobalamin synthesis protein/P47K family protein [Staphylococcus agnetis]
MLNNKTKVTIVNGFLGSGKTTFLSNYMPQILKNDEKVALIVNEFGNFDMDSELLNHIDTKVSLMHGCVCCDLQTELVSTIHHLIIHNQVEHIVIEATGIANPIDMLMACEDPIISQRVQSPHVITIVSASDICRKASFSQAKQQLIEDQMRASHHIIINKIDLLDNAEQLTEAVKAVRKYAPHSQIISTSYGQLSQVLSYDNTTQKMPAQTTGHPTFQSMTYTFQGPIAQDAFIEFILKLPETIHRAKGFIRFRAEPQETIVFQFAQPVPSLEKIGESDVPLSIVLIGEHLDKAQLRNQLDMLQFS